MSRTEVRPGYGLLLQLACRDLWHDRKVSLCIVASLVAVIAPLLLLFGLKHGVVSQLREELLSDPANLEVRMLGNGQFDAGWFERLAAQPGAAFVMPLTRSLNTQADLQRDSRHFVANAEVLPTASGDPLLGKRLVAPLTAEQAILSAAAAERLGVKTGDSFRLMVLRQLDGERELGQVELSVIGVLDNTRFARAAVLVDLSLLIAMEDFRDGFQVPAFGFDSGRPRGDEPRRFARARLYATDLEQVRPLADWLAAERVESVTREREIESVKAIAQVLGLIFAVIAWTAVLGCAASLSGAFLANIDRKRRDLALLQLLGFRRLASALYVILQGMLLTCLAYVLGYGLYAVGSSIFNRALALNLADESFVCRLEPVHLLLAFVSALLLATLVAALGGLRAIHIQPAQSLRDV